MPTLETKSTRSRRARGTWVGLVCVGTLGSWLTASAGLDIRGHFIPSTEAPDIKGDGDLQDLFEAAAESWERAFADPSVNWTVDISYEWKPLKTGPAGRNGQHELVDQEGEPSRETKGYIEFDSSPFTAWFADGNPRHSTAYENYQEINSRFGDVEINAARFSRDPLGDAVDRMDLFSIAAHEIGHALGLAVENDQYIAQVKDRILTIEHPLPHAGAKVTLVGDHLADNPFALMTFIHSTGTRYLISSIDVLVNAQLSHYPNPKLSPQAVPDAGPMALLALANTAGWIAVRGQRSRKS